MAIDEFTAVVRAREFVRKVNPTSIPVTVEAYVNEIAAVIRPQDDLEPDEAGNSFESKGKYFICPNAKDSLERQRFTICHEVAHIKLKLPSQHQTLPWWSYAKRPLAEILCDVFAAELLLPYNLFKPEVENSAVNLADVENLADRFKTSLTATGSRFAAVISTPVAFVLSEKGKVRYASRSTQLKEAGAWIAPRLDFPKDHFQRRFEAGAANDGARTGRRGYLVH